MRRRLHLLVVLPLLAGLLAAAPSDDAVEGHFGRVTTITAERDGLVRLVLAQDAVLLADEQALVDGHPAAALHGGHPALTGLLLTPVLDGRPQWHRLVVRVVRVHDHDHLQVDVLRDDRSATARPDPSAEHDPRRSGPRLAAGQWEVLALAGGEPMTAQLRLVEPSLARPIGGSPTTVAATRSAPVTRHDVVPLQAHPTPDASTIWGGGHTYRSGPATIAMGAFRSELGVATPTGRQYSFSPCRYDGPPGPASYLPGCADVEASPTGRVRIEGVGVTIGNLDADDPVGQWLVDGSGSERVESLGVGYATVQPASNELHVVVVAEAAA